MCIRRPAILRVRIELQQCRSARPEWRALVFVKLGILRASNAAVMRNFRRDSAHCFACSLKFCRSLIDDGLGLQLVPWRPALEQYLGRQLSRVAMSGAA